jgi:hypothetical protein
MLAGKYHRGFPNERLQKFSEPKIKKDDKGFYIMTLSENVKVYVDDFYAFLEQLWDRAESKYREYDSKLVNTDSSMLETASFYRSQKSIFGILLKSIISFYSDANNLGVIMTPWCFGTVVLEKVETYKDRIAKGDVEGEDVGEYPYYVIKYIEETYKKVLLETLDFPPKAFSMRWQYSEILKRYSKSLTNISSSLQNVLLMIKNYTS